MGGWTGENGRRARWAGVLALAATCWASAGCAAREPTVGVCHRPPLVPPGGVTVLSADLDGDGAAERVLLDPRAEQTLEVWRNARRLWAGVPRRLRPWKLALADVDGDGTRELVLGVHKATRFFPRPHNALFVFGFAAGRAFPRWLGSSLSRPFSDFVLGDLDGDGTEELVALERAADGAQCVAVYAWIGFGFDGAWERCGRAAQRLVRVSAGRVVVETAGGGRATVESAGGGRIVVEAGR